MKSLKKSSSKSVESKGNLNSELLEKILVQSKQAFEEYLESSLSILE